MESEFKLLEQQSGRGHFACVKANVKIIPNGIEIIEDINEPIDLDKCEVNRKNYSDWIDAVIEGAKHCAETHVSQGKISGCRIEITRVIGIIVDTTEEDMFCAGALATWQSLNQDKELPSYFFENNKWHIEF